jgi:Glycosyltransferase 61
VRIGFHPKLRLELMADIKRCECDPLVWVPSESGMASSAKQFHKLRIKEVPRDAISDLSDIKSTWFYGFYVNYLKPIRPIRLFVIFFWRNLYFFYVRTLAFYLGSNKIKAWRPLVKLEDYVVASRIAKNNLFDGERVDTPPICRVFPVEAQTYLINPQNSYQFPPIYVAELSNAFVYGGTNLVFCRDAVICHDLYNFERDYTSEELHCRHVIDFKKRRMRLLRYDEMPGSITEAATFLDACAFNYAHWLTEVLPRISAFCMQKDYKSIPLIIDAGLHQNIMASLSSVIDSDRDIYVLPIGCAIKVNKLHVVSTCGYVPFDFRNTYTIPPAQGFFSSAGLSKMSETILKKSGQLQDLPKKIYVRRNSVGKIATNLIEVEKLLLKEGFVFIEPEKLNFEVQAAIFNNAKMIVSSSGAALANLIFCNADVRLVILIGKSRRVSYWYWLNLARAVKCSISYVIGEVPKIDKANNQPNFTVPIESLAKAVCEEKEYKINDQ